jgi:hypothetical protein
VVQGINRIRCRKVVNAAGDCDRADVFIVLPANNAKLGATHFHVTWNMPFNDLPEVDRQLLAKRASRLFASRMVGDRQLVGLQESDEREAAAAARRQSNRSGRANMLNSSRSVGRALMR